MNITIPVNRKRVPHVFIISLLLIGCFVYYVYNKLEEILAQGPSGWIFYLILIPALLYYAVVAFVEYMKTLFDRNASLVITDTSIHDNLSIFSCGRILWDEITGVEVRATTFAGFLIIKVHDPLKYLENKNIIQRRVLKQYIKKMGSPIVISDQRINYNLNELKDLLLIHKSA
jgi:hypothetical protein